MKTIKKPGILINRLPEDMQEDAIALRGYVGTLEARIAELDQRVADLQAEVWKRDGRIGKLERENLLLKQKDLDLTNQIIRRTLDAVLSLDEIPKHSSAAAAIEALRGE